MVMKVTVFRGSLSWIGRAAGGVFPACITASQLRHKQPCPRQQCSDILIAGVTEILKSYPQMSLDSLESKFRILNSCIPHIILI
jgi:hypothetical protein